MLATSLEKRWVLILLYTGGYFMEYFHNYRLSIRISSVKSGSKKTVHSMSINVILIMCHSCIRDISYIKFYNAIASQFSKVLSNSTKIICISIEILILEGSRGRLYRKAKFCSRAHL